MKALVGAFNQRRGLLRDCTTSPINRFSAHHFTLHVGKPATTFQFIQFINMKKREAPSTSLRSSIQPVAAQPLELSTNLRKVFTCPEYFVSLSQFDALLCLNTQAFSRHWKTSRRFVDSSTRRDWIMFYDFQYFSPSARLHSRATYTAPPSPPAARGFMLQGSGSLLLFPLRCK